MKRRVWGGVVVASGALFATGTLSGLVRAQEVTAAGRQAEYLFWLHDRDRLMAKEAADQILVELDGNPLDPRRLVGVYQRGASALRKRNAEATFVSRLTKFRDGLGLPRERVLQGVEGGFRFLPNHPEGQYAIVTFDTTFSSSPVIYTEQLTFGRDPAQGGQWQFVDYYLATKPFYTY